jgi:hypothetical protein
VVPEGGSVLPVGARCQLVGEALHPSPTLRARSAVKKIERLLRAADGATAAAGRGVLSALRSAAAAEEMRR